MSEYEGRVHNPFVGHNDYHCFGCDPHHPAGLKLEFFKRGDRVEATWEPDPKLEGYPGVVHGGIQATLADELGAWYAYAIIGTAGVTKSLQIEYKQTARLEDGPFLISAQGVEVTEKQAEVEVTLRNSSGAELAVARVVYALFSEAVARKRFFFPGKEAFFPA
ncbi:MAG: PaaI family thioesterase [Spirochaetales bacterium]